MQKLRETPTQHLHPLHFAIICRGDAVETAESGRCVYPRAELDIHVVQRREHVATETTKEREKETRLSWHCAPYMHNNNVLSINVLGIHVYRLDSVLFFLCMITINTSVDMSCAQTTVFAQPLHMLTDIFVGEHISHDRNH